MIMAEMAKQRSPNFSMQENSLLAQLMGEDYKDTGLSCHKYNIHRFTSKISRVTKNEMWAEVAEMFSANTTGPHRTADQLEKNGKTMSPSTGGYIMITSAC
ncbi:hypothetical protein DPMN_090855 [Dreissena polymorpha]|uniref:Myb/SANT-like DNA-binding domain-containing protein n=1 Tax=Dreissena polymorpha TaxID=45954 RepID=A0A9D4QZE4_DREPO|nr:hypothetical protein DPMN_090855 [Dreissena polymorpha]